jgi:hypothetical protein
MSSTYINADLRRLVENRANWLCEYCLIAAEDTFLGCEVDHIISEKHGGATLADNLANACVFCNKFKGSDVGSISQQTGLFVRFFNPRSDIWAHHFRISGIRIESLSPIGEVTARILGFNNPERHLERKALADINRYPSAAAALRIKPH